MASSLAKRIQRVLQKELLIRLLIRHFALKFENEFDVAVYPPLLLDLPWAVPELMNKIEIVPYVEEADPTTGLARLGWNLFVLGNERMFLGTTTHSNLAEIQAGAQYKSRSGDNLVRTPREIIKFIMRILGSRRMIPIDPVQAPFTTNPMIPTNRPQIGPSMSGGYYEKNRIV